MSTPVLVNWAAVSGLILTVSVCQVFDIEKISLADWIINIGLAVSSLVAFTSMTLALKLISPNLASSLQLLELVLAYGVQALLTGASPDIWSCFGGGLILLGFFVMNFLGYLLCWILDCEFSLPILTQLLYRQ